MSSHLETLPDSPPFRMYGDNVCPFLRSLEDQTLVGLPSSESDVLWVVSPVSPTSKRFGEIWNLDRPMNRPATESDYNNEAISQPTMIITKRSTPKTGTETRSIIKEKWEGVVLKLSDDSFFARLTRESDGMQQEAEFPLAEISEFERPSVAAGSRFYWIIAYRDTNGVRRRISELYFRRLPKFSQQERTQAETEAERLRERIGWNNPRTLASSA